MANKILILVGPTRTSTTSLFRMFSQLFGVTPSLQKETNFFLDDELDSLGDDALRDKFLEAFSGGDGKCFLEASPLYFLHGRRVATRIERLAKCGFDVTLLITLRDPLERFWSLYKHIISKRSVGLHQDFDAFVSGNLAALSVANPVSEFGLDYLSLYESCYSRPLGEWLEFSSSLNIKVEFFENIISDGGSNRTLLTLLSWMGVEGQELAVLKENKSKLVRNRFIHGFSLRINDTFEPFLNKNKWIRDVLRDIYYRFNGVSKSNEIPRGDMRRVVSVLAGDAVALRESLSGVVIQGDLPSWVLREYDCG